MYFKDLTQNSPVYILDKQSMTLTQGKVVSRGFPRMDISPMSGTSGMVVDISIESDGKTANYVIPESSSVTYAGNLVLSVDKPGLVSEVQAMKAGAEQHLASVDRQRQIIEKSTSRLEELDQTFKERQETDKRFSKIENSVNELKDMITQMIKRSIN